MRVVLVVAALWANMALAQTAEKPLPKWGIMLDGGLPDGAGLSGVFRPFYWLRANAGLTYNLGGLGVRGGLSLVPFSFVITPSLNVEVGHSFPGDVTKLSQLAKPIAADLSQAAPVLKDLSYDYGSAQLGLELGPPQQFVFFLRAGVSYIQTTISGDAIQSLSGDTSITAKPLKLKATAPSAKLGFILYF